MRSKNPGAAWKPLTYHQPPLTDHQLPWQLAGQVQNCRVLESSAPKNLRLQTGSPHLFREPYVCDSCRDRRRNEALFPCTCPVRFLIAAFGLGSCLFAETPNRHGPFWHSPKLAASPRSSDRMNSPTLKRILRSAHSYSDRFQTSQTQAFPVPLPHSYLPNCNQCNIIVVMMAAHELF